MLTLKLVIKTQSDKTEMKVDPVFLHFCCFYAAVPVARPQRAQVACG